MAHPTVVRSAEEVRENIRRYQNEIELSEQLAARARRARAWYGEPAQDGTWLFAPSKFVGYRFSSAREYLGTSGKGGDRDGGETERALRDWYKEIDPRTHLGEKLFASLRQFLDRFHVAPNKVARINVPRDMVESAGLSRTVAVSLLDRIASSPDICGGRPVIRGTRMRVTDIVEALAQGATRDELLRDFDYLTAEDLAAALSYAARAADHRIVRTA